LGFVKRQLHLKGLETEAAKVAHSKKRPEVIIYERKGRYGIFLTQFKTNKTKQKTD